jgi:glycosyltransferase involved in cell wall biosynthesis
MTRQLLINLSYLLEKPTGTSTYALNLLPYLQQIDSTLLGAQKNSKYSCHSVPDDLTAEHGAQGHLRRLLWTQFQLPKIYRKLRSKLLFSPIPEAPIFAPCRYVVTVHDLIPLRFPERFSPLSAYCYHYLPQVLQQAQHIVCNSIATAQDIHRFFNISEEKISPILLAYDAKNFHFLDLPTHNYFLYLGRSAPYKNVQRLISAFANLSDCSNYELWIAGPTDKRYTPALAAQIERLGLENQVKFLEYLPYAELNRVINQAIALVFPSLWEGFGLPVLEAMACGTPVITSNLSSLPEVAGNAALLVNPYDVGEIAEAMNAMVNTPGLRAHLQSLGLQRAREFSWEKTGKATVEVLARYL